MKSPRHPSVVVAILFTCAAGSVAQSIQARTPVADVPAALIQLESLGFDVAGHDRSGQTVDVIGGAAVTGQLAGLGLWPELIATSAPFSSLAAGLADPGDIPTGYATPAQITAFLQNAAAAYPSICTLHNLTAEYGFTGGTFEGRPILGLKISDNPTVNEDEPNVLFVACHHARELNTCEVVMDHINRILTGYGTNPQITGWVDNHEIWMVPVWNPDGHAYVWSSNNMWRKNRRNFGNGIGVDLNRNYALGWNGGCPGSTSLSNETYRGPSAVSEIESQVMTNFATDRHFAKLIDFHSYGREVLYTYLCSSFPAPLESWYAGQAAALSAACNYTSTRKPSAEGEHYQWELNHFGAFAFLIELGTAFQPAYTEVTTEKTNTFGGVTWIMNHATPLQGHIRDACTGTPIVASWTVAGLTFTQGELRNSEARFGRYQDFLPGGTYTITFTAPGYVPSVQTVAIGTGTTTLDVNMTPLLTLTVPATVSIGSTATLTALAPIDAAHGYAIATGISGTAPGTVVGGCTIPINADFVTSIALGNLPPFSQFAGLLSGTGAATATLAIPSDPLLIGFGIDFALATIPSTSPLQVRSQATASHLTIGP